MTEAEAEADGDNDRDGGEDEDGGDSSAQPLGQAVSYLLYWYWTTSCEAEIFSALAASCGAV